MADNIEKVKDYMHSRKVYISIPHVEDDDADYYVAATLSEAIGFLCFEEADEFLLSSEANINGIREDDYIPLSTLKTAPIRLN